MTLHTAHTIINRICGVLATLGIPCLIVGIILIVKDKSKSSKIRGIILVCFIPASIIIRFISSLIFRKLGVKNYENQPYHGIQPSTQNESVIYPGYNQDNGGRATPTYVEY